MIDWEAAVDAVLREQTNIEVAERVIPVRVQMYMRPSTAREVGYASCDLSPAKVAKAMGIPPDVLVAGKIARRKGGDRVWLLITRGK